jgi:hypothetical protein
VKGNVKPAGNLDGLNVQHGALSVQVFVIDTVSFLTGIKVQDTAVIRDRDSEGVTCVDFVSHGVTINEQYYSNLLHYDAHQTVQKKRPGKLSGKRIHMLDTTHPHMAHVMGQHCNNGLENPVPPTCSPDLGPVLICLDK